MLETIADFWKPTKKMPAVMALKPNDLQMGSQIGFGFVPQSLLSGRRFETTAINTYQFGADILTSFVLTQENDAGVSLIIAESDDESDDSYVAISRRIPMAERAKLFKPSDIEALLTQETIKDLVSLEVSPAYKHWVAPHYTRELHKVKGLIHKGDYRQRAISESSDGVSFEYTLLVSDSHDVAIEIENYDNGRQEIYATCYRPMSDIGAVSYPAKVVLQNAQRADVKLVSNGVNGNISPVAAAKKSPALVSNENTQPATKEAAKEMPKSEVQEAAKTTPIQWPELHVPKPEMPKPENVAAAIKITSTAQPYIQQEIKAVSQNTQNFVNESIDCELHVANRIIDEAIRNEMRINDVVRRVVGLPVAHQESVQIPIAITDQDYALLAIRYGISASDRDAIKKRIIQDLADFSGADKKKAA